MELMARMVILVKGTGVVPGNAAACWNRRIGASLNANASHYSSWAGDLARLDQAGRRSPLCGRRMAGHVRWPNGADALPARATTPDPAEAPKKIRP
jgi:hypothetical protein